MLYSLHSGNPLISKSSGREVGLCFDSRAVSVTNENTKTMKVMPWRDIILSQNSEFDDGAVMINYCLWSQVHLVHG